MSNQFDANVMLIARSYRRIAIRQRRMIHIEEDLGTAINCVDQLAKNEAMDIQKEDAGGIPVHGDGSQNPDWFYDLCREIPGLMEEEKP
jgi:hypothetical protein